MANAFRQQQLYLLPEKSIQIINKYQSIKKYDRTVSAADDENKNVIIVSPIQKNDRIRKKVRVGASFRAQDAESDAFHHPSNPHGSDAQSG